VLYFKLSTTPWRRSGEWRYSSTHSLTSFLDGGEWSVYPQGMSSWYPLDRTVSSVRFISVGRFRFVRQIGQMEATRDVIVTDANRTKAGPEIHMVGQ